jgi:hypothetical protein
MLALITNKNLLRINQDEEARPPIAFQNDSGNTRVYFKHLSNGEYAFGLFNLGDNDDRYVRANLTDFGLSGSSGLAFALTDAFTDEPAGTVKETICFRVPAHDCRVFLARLVEA